MGLVASGGPALPEYVFAPAHSQVRDSDKDVVFEVGSDGGQVLPVFSTVGAGVSIVASGAGVIAGVIVAYGVADFGHNLIDENWGGDIYQHGVVFGVADGIGDSAVKTGQDFVHLGSSAVHGVEHLWHSIF
jgi:hypothetical protein